MQHLHIYRSTFRLKQPYKTHIPINSCSLQRPHQCTLLDHQLEKAEDEAEQLAPPTHTLNSTLTEVFLHAVTIISKLRYKDSDCLVNNATTNMKSLSVSQLTDINQRISQHESDTPRAYAANSKQLEIEDAPSEE